MLDDELSAAGVAYERARARIVHRIGEIADENDIEPEPRHLAKAKAAVENADIGMHAHEGDVVDTFLPEEVVDLLPALADAVEADDVDGRVLARPGIRGTFPFFHYWVIATAGGVIDGEVALLHGLARTAIKNRDRGRRSWRTLHALAPGCSFVELHRVAGGVHDHHAETAGGTHHLIHSWSHRVDALRRKAAGVGVPHIADDDGRLGDFPAQHVFRGTAFTPARRVGTPASPQAKRARDAGPVADSAILRLRRAADRG